MACHGIACACCDCAVVYRRRGLRGNGLAAAALLLIAAAGGQSGFFDPATAPGFGDPRPGLRAYLARERPAGPRHVCVVGYRHADGDHQAWAHWREGRRLILWDGGGDRLGWGRRDLHLTRDVVPTEADIGASTYLVTRAWADRVTADCAARGVHYIIAR